MRVSHTKYLIIFSTEKSQKLVLTLPQTPNIGTKSSSTLNRSLLEAVTAISEQEITSTKRENHSAFGAPNSIAHNVLLSQRNLSIISFSDEVILDVRLNDSQRARLPYLKNLSSPFMVTSKVGKSGMIISLMDEEYLSRYEHFKCIL